MKKEKDSKKSDEKNPDSLTEKINNLGFGESMSINLSDLMKQVDKPEQDKEEKPKK